MNIIAINNIYIRIVFTIKFYYISALTNDIL